MFYPHDQLAPTHLPRDDMRRLPPLLALVLVITSLGPAEGRPAESGFRALSGSEASGFVVPADMKLVRAFSLGNGFTYQRFQQMYGEAEVLGGQVSVFRGPTRSVKTVVGSHYPSITLRNSVGISRAAAARTAERDVGPVDRRTVKLRIDPQRGTYFYEVESRELGARWIHRVDAASGRVLRRIDALADAHGTGVKRDTKDMNGPNNTSTRDDLTKYHDQAGHGASDPHWDLFSKDNRQRTFDARNDTTSAYFVTEADNHWTNGTSNRRSPGDPALVDAQYYANKTDDFYLNRLGLNWLDCYAGMPMKSVAHYGINVANAGWNGEFVIYGDGDGVTTREMSGALDIVSHEWTHGVTGCTSELVYADESGALNESFSDVMSAAAEFFVGEPLSSNCVLAAGQGTCADWWLGEDVVLTSDVVPGDRNLKDPREDDDPDHYSERFTGTQDNGGIHTNSGIPNHAFYLLVKGGKNAGCDSSGSNGHTHTANCDVTVSGIGLGRAEQIFFLGFIGLPENASMCTARKATVAQARSLYGRGSAPHKATVAAWRAVGVPSAC